MKNIEWRPVKNYEGHYEVSNMGGVRSIKFNKVKVHKQGLSEFYMIVGLYKDGKAKTRTVHQLVAEAFHNHKPCGRTLVVDHINFIKTDNRSSNLQIVTVRENNVRSRGFGSSKYVGVHKRKGKNKWRAIININKKQISIGTFNNELDASIAYQNKLKEYYEIIK